MRDTSDLVTSVRFASRDLVRLWGFLDKTVAGSDLSGSAVHALIEVGLRPGLTATDLAARLHLEKSTVSRLVRSLVDRSELQETVAAEDGRMRKLALTDKGRQTLAVIDQNAEAQVAGALGRLAPGRAGTVVAGLTEYAAALRGMSDTGPQQDSPAPHPAGRDTEIQSGYEPGLIGRVTEISARRILRDYPFGAAFETKVAREMSEFISRLGASVNQIWHAHNAGRMVGSIAIDGERMGNGCAHLRWFMVDDGQSGRGIGARLLDHALDHCDTHGFRETHLWTLKGLNAARRLYERTGFQLAEEFSGDQWGAAVTEQRFVRPNPVASDPPA